MSDVIVQTPDPRLVSGQAADAGGPEWSYQRHRRNEIEHVDHVLPTCYAQTDTVDAWRQERMRGFVNPLLESYPDATWLTVGDLYGEDAHYLKRRGAQVLATSLSDHLLQIALRNGLIDACQSENAEQLSAADDSFDFVLCKESYHHFPRPAVAFYEMLRVARRGVMLTEPQESQRGPVDFVKSLAKRLLRGDRTDQFESWGNFIYRVRVSEIRKMLMGLNYTTLAFRRFNDFYHPRLAQAKYSPTSPASLLTKLGIRLQDLLCRLRLLDYGLVSVVAFKETPSAAARQSLQHAGFRVVDLPLNPYLHNNATGKATSAAEMAEGDRP